MSNSRMNIRQRQQPQHLPEDVLLQIQARASRSCHPVMKLVSKSWNSIMSSDELFTLRRNLGVTEQWLYILLETRDMELLWYSIDPHGVWRQLARPPFLNIDCSLAELDGFLYVIGGYYTDTNRPSSVWRYDPRANTWSSVTSMSSPRVECKTGVFRGLLSLKWWCSDGCSLREYDVEHGCWRVVASTEVPLPVYASRVLSWNGRLHVVGKSSEDGNVIVVLRAEVCGRGRGELEFTVVGSRRIGSGLKVAACQAVAI